MIYPTSVTKEITNQRIEDCSFSGLFISHQQTNVIKTYINVFIIVSLIKLKSVNSKLLLNRKKHRMMMQGKCVRKQTN